MPVPTSIDDLSTTAGSNSPSGSETPTEGDNYLRTLASFVALLRDKLDGTSATGTLTTPTLSGDSTAGYILTPAVSAVIAYRAANTTYSAGTNTFVFNTETADRGGNFDNATGIFTAPKTGLYQLNAGLRLQNNAVSSLTYSGAYFSRNDSTTDGADVVRIAASVSEGSSVNAASNAFNASGSALMSLTSGDTVRVKLTHTGANLTFLAGSHFSARFVG